MAEVYRRKKLEIIIFYVSAVILSGALAQAFVYDLKFGSLPRDLLWRLTGAGPLGFGVYFLLATARAKVVFHGDRLVYMDALVRRRIPWEAMEKIVIKQVPYYLVTLYYVVHDNRRTKIEIQVEHFRRMEDIIEALIRAAEEKAIELKYVSES